MDEYIVKLKTTIASEIRKDEEILKSMRSYLGKLTLNHIYGREHMPELESGIKKNEQALKVLIEFYEGIPRYISLRDIFIGVCKEGNTFNKQDNMKYVEEHLSAFKNIESGERLCLTGHCTTRVNADTIKKYEDLEIPADGYYIYSLVGHTGEYEIYSVPNIGEVEKEILSGTGIKNILISEMLVLYNGKIKKYHIINKNGTRLSKGQIEKMNGKTVRKLQVV